MARDPAARMPPEEAIGLLRQHGNGSQDDDLSLADEDQGWKEQQDPLQHRTLRPRWGRVLAFTLFAICIVLAFTYFARTSNAHNNTGTASSAHLRAQEDYILDPQWDFYAIPTTREYTWVIEEHTLNPDGVYRPMVLINSTFPGPLIECNEGDEIVVHVHNHATNATSIHWHGLYQNGTNWMDGTVGVTQCPIAPGYSFTYRFNVTGQSGTYHYHSHMSMQASDGLVGPLVIHARGGEEQDLQKIDYSQDRVVLLSDHYYDPSHQLLMQYLAPGSENDEPVPPSALINGRNLRNCSTLPNRNCSTTDNQRAVLDISPDTNTRLRIINVGAFAEFSLQVDEHEFFLTEVDGTDVIPQSLHRLNINPAQRYSIVLTPPKEQNKGLYWMRARMITHCFAYEEPELQEEVWGVVRYNTAGGGTLDGERGARGMTPHSKDWTEIIEVECRDLNTSTLEPVKAIPAPATVDHMVYLRSSFQIRDWALSRGYLNDSSFRINATSPILTTLLKTYKSPEATSDGINASPFNPSTQLIYQTTGTPTIDILIQNLDDGNHPFHLHGYKFWLLAQGHAYPPPTPDLYASLNLTNPLRRDVASVEAFGWTLLRFVADNPGVWAFHCHLAWHTEAGLMMVFANRVEEMRVMDVPGEVRGLCGVEGVERGVGPDDGIWVGTWK
jgi:FtsP/CotA-like multicopper oxidase with cupredoxin domain